MEAVADDLFSPGAVADPHPVFDVLRAEDPVHWNPRHQAWVLTRYDDVVAGFREPRFSAERVAAPPSDGTPEAGTDELVDRLLGGWMVLRSLSWHPTLVRRSPGSLPVRLPAASR